jgi:hypothetical protein
MIKHWTVFDGRPYGAARDAARVTLNPKKTFLLNEPACKALGNPVGVVLMYDQARNMIGLKPTNIDRQNAFPLKSKKGCRFKLITASSFCTHFGIRVDRTVLFENVQVDPEGIMTLDINKTIYVSRGAR